MKLIKYIFNKSNIRKFCGKAIKISPILCALFLVASYQLGVYMDRMDYNRIAVQLYETVSSNILTALILSFVSVWHKLCFYNWLCIILIASTSFFNIFCAIYVTQTDYAWYTHIYSYTFMPFALLLIITFYIKDTQNIKNEINMD